MHTTSLFAYYGLTPRPRPIARRRSLGLLPRSARLPGWRPALAGVLSTLVAGGLGVLRVWPAFAPDGQIRTKGDGRPQPDPFTLPRTAVDRRVLARIPSGGRVLAFFHSAPGLLWLFSGGVLLFGLPLLQRRREAEAPIDLRDQLARPMTERAQRCATAVAAAPPPAASPAVERWDTPPRDVWSGVGWAAAPTRRLQPSGRLVAASQA